MVDRTPRASTDLSGGRRLGAVLAGLAVLAAVVGFTRLPPGESPGTATSSVGAASARGGSATATLEQEATVTACRSVRTRRAASGFDVLLGELTAAAADAQAYYSYRGRYTPSDYFQDELGYREVDPVLDAAAQAVGDAALTPRLPEPVYEAMAAETEQVAELRATLRMFLNVDQVVTALGAMRGAVTSTDQACAPAT